LIYTPSYYNYHNQRSFNYSVSGRASSRENLLWKTGLDRVDLLNRFPLGQFIVPPVPPSAPTRRDSTKPNHSPRELRVILLNVDIRNQPSDGSSVPRDERQIRDRHLVPNQILLLGKHGVEHPENPLDLVIVSLDCARDLLVVGPLEPRGLAEVWAGWVTVSEERGMRL